MIQTLYNCCFSLTTVVSASYVSFCNLSYVASHKLTKIMYVMLVPAIGSALCLYFGRPIQSLAVVILTSYQRSTLLLCGSVTS